MDIIESIRDIPVQDPPEEEFSSANLNWSKFGTAGQNNEVALIPNARVDAFIIGECSNIECPTRFHIERVRKRCKGSLKEYASDEYLEYRKYWCSFGPENYGEGGGILPSRRYRLETRNRAAIPQSMRGCTCHFIVKRLYACPSLALIIYNNKRHINKAGFVCHGPLDGDAIGPGAKKIPYICNEIQQQTMSMIYLGIPEENILDKHIEGIERYCGSNAKAKSLASQYVHKLGMIIKRSTHELDLDDQVSIRMWVDRNKKSVFFYQDNSDNDAFILGIQTEWQLQQMVRFGHHSLIASDSTVGLKNLKYPLCTLLVFDSRQHALPIAWIITRSNAKTDVTKWMKALLDRIRVVDQSWTSKGFIIDDPITEIDSIRDIFSCPILFSIWRVRRSWLRHIVKKCNSVEVQQEIFKRLGEIVYSIWEGDDYLVALEDLIHSFVDQSAFLQYFKASWVPKLEMWLNTMRTVPLASQEASGAIEAYHVKLKLKLYDDDSPVGALQRLQRVDWLAHKLTTELHSSYWLDRYADESGSFSNVKEEYINSTSWYRAKQIPDSAVILDDKDNLFAKVTSQKDNTLTHQVFNPGSEFAFCDCSWSLQGNICKHIIKVNMFCKNHKEYKDPMSLKSFEEILSELQRKPVDDSISMDLSMAWALQMLDQIQKLVELSGSENIAGVVNNMPLKWVAKKGRTSVGRPFDPLALPSSLKSKRAPCRKNRKRKRLAQLC